MSKRLSGNNFILCIIQAWTNGRLHSPVHRVEMARESDRCSIQLFSLSKPGHFIELKFFGLLGYGDTEAGYTTPPSDLFKAYYGI
uniref:Isopenicillin N synthase-like Fe(2+) 2OG dioxygenase domain-containing protein n=1 Tax=Solanum lycopersicum TaxID=4081 RepID=A0A3Q7EYP6_SOLLC